MINSLLNSAQSMEWIETLVDVVLKSAVILLVAGAISLVGRHAAASTRHLVWTLALGSLLLLPVLTFVLPDWRISLLPSLVSSPRIDKAVDDNVIVGSRSAGDVEIPGPSAQAMVEEPLTPVMPNRETSAVTAGWFQSVKWEQLQWTQMVLLIWLLGALVVLARLAMAMIRAWTFARQCEFVIDYKWTATAKRLEGQLQLPGHVTLRRSRHITTPMTCGILSPVVLLPEKADRWSEEWRQIVLLHELAHIKRHDCLTQMLAALACAIYWFNPLVWWAAHRLRVEREMACDDHVLEVGTKPSDYAGHLVEIAKSLGAENHLAPAAVGMACSQLENRVRAILDPNAKRRGVDRPMAFLLTASAVCLIVPLAMARPWNRAETSMKDAWANSAADADSSLDQSPQDKPETADSLWQEAAKTSLTSKQSTLGDSQTGPNREDPKDDQDEGAGLGTEFSQRIRKGMRQEIKQGLIRGIKQGLGQGLGEGIGRGIGQGLGQGLGKGIGQGLGQGLGKGIGQGIGQGIGRGIRQGFGQGEGQGTGQGSSTQNTELTADQIIQMKMHNVTPEFIESMRKQGFENITVRQLVEMRIHGINEDFIKQARTWGDGKLTVRELVQLKISGVTPEFINAMKQTGYDKLTIKQLSELRLHNVTPEFIAAMRRLGYDNLTAHQLTSLKIHGVNEEFVKEMQNWMGGKPSVNDLLQVKIHGITPDFANRMKALGFENLSINKLTQLKIHGVSEEFVKEMRSLGFDKLTPEQILQMRIHGVDAEYVKKMRAAGLKNVSVNQMIEMKIHGIDSILFKGNR